MINYFYYTSFLRVLNTLRANFLCKSATVGNLVLIMTFVFSVFACRMNPNTGSAGIKNITGSFTYTLEGGLFENETASIMPIVLPDPDGLLIEIKLNTSETLVVKWSGVVDKKQYRYISYSLEPSDDEYIVNGNIKIDESTGSITIDETLPMLDRRAYTVTATAADAYEGTSEFDLFISVGSRLMGTFSYDDISTIEGIPVDSKLPNWTGTVPSNIRYSINLRSNIATIDPMTGLVSILHGLNFDSLSEIGTIIVTVRNDENILGLTTEISITLTDWCDSITESSEPTLDSNQVYQISNWKEFIHLSQNILQGPFGLLSSTKYALTSDITLPHKDCEVSFISIGSNDTPFRGTFDGGGHSIDGLYIYNESQNYAGLFGALRASSSDAVIVKDLTLVNPEITAHAVAGALGGYLIRGTVKNVYSRAAGSVRTVGEIINKTLKISAAGFTGGLLGATSDEGIVSGGMSELTVVGSIDTGGLVGHAEGRIEGYTTGSVTGTYNVGGLVGFSEGSVQGYSTGDVEGSWNNVGGLVGLADSVSRSVAGTKNISGYTTGSVTGTYNVGGLVGLAKVALVGYSIGDVTGAGATGAMVGVNDASLIGYSRSTVYSTDSSRINFGLIAGTSKSTSSQVYYSKKDGESNLYSVSSNGRISEYNRDVTVLGTQVLVSDIADNSSLQSTFSLFDFGDMSELQWSVQQGNWPAINLPALINMDDAKDSIAEQGEFTAP